VALTQPIPIVRLVDGARWYALVRRGFLPAWVKDPKTFSTNRRFATPCGGGAALFPPTVSMNGTPARRSARPYFVRPKSGGAITFAGLWETWTERRRGRHGRDRHDTGKPRSLPYTTAW